MSDELKSGESKAAELKSAELKSAITKMKDPFPDIYGQEGVKQQLKSALLMGRHVIIVGPPGVGKTTLAKDVAGLLSKDAPFVRVQGSPDLTAEDLIGDIDPMRAIEFGPLDKRAFTPGKIFRAHGGVLFFDEVNRCPEKLQNALLQVLEEGKATIGGYNVDFPADFIFIGTMNPEDSSTEKLSDVFLDRFDIITMGYPEKAETEQDIVLKKSKKLDVEFPVELRDFCVGFVRYLRQNDKLEKKPSLRASIGLCERASSNALLAKRKHVEFEDIKECVQSVISHRIRLKPSARYLKTPSELVQESFDEFSATFLQTNKPGDYR